MRAIHIVAGLWLGALATTTMACDLPALVVIPPKDKVGDQSAAIRDATKAYFDQMGMATPRCRCRARWLFRASTAHGQEPVEI